MKSQSSTSIFVLSIGFITSLIILFSNLFLSWDASNHLYKILQTYDFYTVYNRWFIKLLQLPIILSLNIIKDLSLSYSILLYGSLFSFFSFFILVLNYVISEKQKDFLFFSSLFFISIGFYQYYPVSEHLIALQLFWTLVNYDLCKREHKYFSLGLLVLSFLLITSHPVSALYLILWGVVRFFFMSRKVMSEFLFFNGIGLCRGFLIFHNRDQQKLSNLLHSSNHFDLTDILIIISLVLLVSSCFMYLRRSLKVWGGSFAISSFLLFYCLFTDSLAVWKTLDLKFLISVFGIFLIGLYVWKKNDIEEKYLKVSVITHTIFYFVLITSFSFDRINRFSKLDDYFTQLDRNCLELESLPKELGIFHFADKQEYIFYQGTITPKRFLIDKMSCERFYQFQNIDYNEGKTFKFNLMN